MASDIFVLTSLSEGLNLTLLEAKARGIPIIASNVGGNPEVITHGENGFLFAPRDAVALAKCIADLLDNEELRQRFSEKGKAVFRENFNAQRMVEATFTLYASLLNARKTSNGIQNTSRV